MKDKIRSLSIIWFGALLVAIGTYYFLMPNNIAAGGISGIAIIIKDFFPMIPVGALMMCMEVVLFIVGIIVIGPVFGSRTIFCSFSISGMIILFEEFCPMVNPISTDIFMQLVFGILICGTGMGIVFAENASTGGTDIIAMIINKYTNISIGKAILSVDILVTIAAAFVFGLEKGLYAILGVIINGVLIDKVIQSLKTYNQVAIISSKGEEIKKYIVDNLDRSATIYVAKGAYHETEREVITTVLNRKQFIKLKDYIQIIDEKAFITVQYIRDVFGEGFIELNSK